MNIDINDINTAVQTYLDFNQVIYSKEKSVLSSDNFNKYSIKIWLSLLLHSRAVVYYDKQMHTCRFRIKIPQENESNYSKNIIYSN